jgi:hypothetical protein
LSPRILFGCNTTAWASSSPFTTQAYTQRLRILPSRPRVMEESSARDHNTPSAEPKSQSPASTLAAQAHASERRADAAAAPSTSQATPSSAPSEASAASAHFSRLKQGNSVTHETEGASGRHGGAEQAHKVEQTPPM